MKNNHPDLKVTELSKLMGKMWKELSDEDKRLYNDLAEADKKRSGSGSGSGSGRERILIAFVCFMQIRGRAFRRRLHLAQVPLDGRLRRRAKRLK